MKKLIVILLMLISSNSYALIGSFSSSRSMSINVAAANAPQAIKDGADYLCDGTNDEVQIQVALDAITKYSTNSGNQNGIGASVSLSAGEFIIGSPIILTTGTRLSGQGIHVTNLTLDAGANCNMFEFDEIGGLSIFIDVSYMMCSGRTVSNTSGSCFVFKTSIKDFHCHNIFIQDFSDNGLEMNGSWGCVLDNVIIEFCEGYGALFEAKNQYTCTGDTVSGGNLIKGVGVTQGAAIGRMYSTSNNGASTIDVVWGSGDAFTTGSPITDGTASYTPTGVTQSSSQGPKILNCKMMDNDKDNLYLHDNSATTIVNSEFRSQTSGYSAIVLDGSIGTIINGNAFHQNDTGAISYIEMVYTDGATKENLITNNYFVLLTANVPAIYIPDTGNVYANVIKDNLIKIVNAGTLFMTDITSWPSRQLVVDNYVISQPSVDGVGYTFLGDDINVRLLPNTADRAVLAYAIGNTFSTRLHTATRAVILPKAFRGYWLRFNIDVAQAFQLTPNDGTDSIFLNNHDGTFTEAAGGEYVWADAVGEYIILECRNDTDWYAVEQAGTWTEQTP